MIDKVKQIRAEVERLKNENTGSPISVCDDIIAFIDSQQEEPVSEDLEKEIDRYWKNAPTGTLYFPMWEYFQIIAHHFAEWGKKQAEIEIQAQSMALTHGCPKEGEE